MRIVSWSALFLGIVVGLFACTNPFRPGRCDQTSDCQAMGDYANDVCDLDPTPQGNGRCVPKCTTVGDCAAGKVCDFDMQGIGRCLNPTGTDGGGVDGDGEGGVDGGGDAHPEAPTCSTCGGSTPLCLSGTCVQCLSSADCTGETTKPICDIATHTCGPCTSDSQCTSGPGICMSHQDGHCATDAEALYVQNTTGCLSTFRGTQGDGSTTVPYCSMDPVGLALTSSSTRSLVVVRGTVAGPSWTYQRAAGQAQTSVVGQQSAVIASSTAPSWSMDSGTVYVRDVRFTSSAAIGIKATGGTLRLGGVTVDSCQGGGILLDGAAFDIENTTVTNNGPSTDLSWGGIRVASLPAAAGAKLHLVTVQNNKAAGVSCVGAVEGDGVFAAGNAAGDVASACNFTPCSSAATGTCGAQ